MTLEVSLLTQRKTIHFNNELVETNIVFYSTEQYSTCNYLYKCHNSHTSWLRFVINSTFCMGWKIIIYNDLCTGCLIVMLP